ncbi:MAG: T9SS type A sorting domain-containing protein [Flavobacteriales bacterium]|nr:T9SS type A sorting domain-containing protein [Flavobacteriales bacterium]
MKKFFSFIVFTFYVVSLNAQTPVKLNFKHLLGSEAFQFGQTTSNNLSEEFNVGRMEYYVSGISLTHDGGKKTNLSEIYILVNAGADDTTFLGNLNITTLEAVNFSIGVDPMVNNADPTQWPASHALSPKSPSMHWGWSSGYRFVAMEGKTGSSLATTFEIHALGNKNYFAVSIPHQGQKNGDDLVITVHADYTKAIENVSIASGLIYHGEDNEGLSLLRNFRTEVFSSPDGQKNTLAGINTISQNVINVFPNPSADGSFEIQNLTGESGLLELFDITGKRVLDVIISDKKSIGISGQLPGIYFVQIRYNTGLVVRDKLIVQ